MSEDRPFTLRESAAALHEMFVSLIAAGFTAEQALYLCGQALQGKAPK